MTEGTKIGLKIRAARIAVGLTQEIVANDLDISLSYYGQIERGNANPTVNMVAKIKTYLAAATTSPAPRATARPEI